MTDQALVVWLDAQLSPALTRCLQSEFGVAAQAIRDLGLRNAEDPTIFAAARAAGAVVMTKDYDFVQLLERFGPPPQIVWLTCGHTSNARLRDLLQVAWPRVSELLLAGEALIEISDPAT